MAQPCNHLWRRKLGQIESGVLGIRSVLVLGKGKCADKEKDQDFHGCYRELYTSEYRQR